MASILARHGAFEAAMIGYVALIVLLALTAVFSAKPHRREAAMDVLRILVPGRRRQR